MVQGHAAALSKHHLISESFLAIVTVEHNLSPEFYSCKSIEQKAQTDKIQLVTVEQRDLPMLESANSRAETCKVSLVEYVTGLRKDRSIIETD